MDRRLIKIALLFLLISCLDKYNTKTINNQQYIHVFKNLYYRVNPDLIQTYYSGKSNNLYWTKFSYSIDSFAKAQVYITGEKKTDDEIKKINNNLETEVRKNYRISNSFKKVFFNELNYIPHVSFLSHFDPGSKVEAVKGSWQKGYEWVKKGAGTEIRLYFTSQKYIIDYEIIIEYQPGINAKKDAEKKYLESSDKIALIIKSLLIT
jgi:hypothetical protein